MPVDPLDIDPPNDTGSNVFARFRYQAQVAAPYCANMLLGGEVRCVVPEHIEDIAVEYEWGWIFLQVKTRDPSRGLWRLRDILAEGGGLRSLWRAHQVLGEAVARLELHLEGHVDQSDTIAELLVPLGQRSLELCTRVSDGLEVAITDATSFLARVTVREAPPRAAIRSMNVTALGERVGRITASTVAAAHDLIVDEICRAMAQELPGDARLRYITDPTAAPPALRDRVLSKRLTPDRMDVQRRLVTPPPPPPLLSRDSSSATGESITALERKLREAGAPTPLVDRAKSLRAIAVAHEAALFAQSIDPDDRRLEDVQERLLTQADVSTSVRHGQPNPAAHVFHDLHASVHANRGTLDPHGLFGQDPLLLLGEICELSDQCRTGWGA